MSRAQAKTGRVRVLARAATLDNFGEGLALVGAMLALALYRPRLRLDCRDAERPCPMVGCRSNLIMDVGDDGTIILNSGLLDAARGEGANRVIDDKVTAAEFHRQVDEVLSWWERAYDRARRLRTNAPDSCLEDVIDRHLDKMGRLADDDPRYTDGLHLEDVGAALFITRERARQIEETAWRQLLEAAPRLRRSLEAWRVLRDGAYAGTIRRSPRLRVLP